MKKITLPDFERNHVKKTNRWLGWLSFCLMFLLMSSTITYGQGNTCIAPLVVTSLPYSNTGNTANYGNDYVQGNVPATAPGATITGTSSGVANYLNGFDVVYTITPIINGQITITTTNDDDWVALWAFTGCPFSSTVGYHTAISGTSRNITDLPVVANTTYSIVLSNWNAPGINYTINITGTAGLLTPLTECTGIPSGGTAVLSPNGANAGSIFTANATGVTLASGLNYQWQKLVGGTWTNIEGATTINSQIIAESGAVGTTTDYRLEVTCVSSNQVSYSSAATFTIQLVYCASVPTSNNNAGITNVTLGTSSFPITDVTYYNHPTTVNLIAGITNQALITFGTGFTYGTNIWIDLNDNGTFEASELLFQGESTNDNPTVYDASFLIDAGATLGMHRMRIGTANVLQTPPNPCYSGTAGVTVDVIVNILAPPACLPPSALTASNITATSADLSWFSTGTLFDIEWGTQGFAQGSGTIITGVNFPYTLTVPTPNAQYSYYVRQDCGVPDGTSLWSGPFNFRSACAPAAAFFENFDTSVTGTTAPLPSCWERAGNGNTYLTTGSVAPNSPANRLYMFANGIATTPTEGFAITPTLSNLQAETHRLKFKAYCTTAGRTMEIGYFTDISDLSSFVTVEVIALPGIAQSATLEFSVEPTSVPAGVTNLAFRNNAPTGGSTIYIDDVAWEQIPACADITTVQTQTFNSNSATITWEPGGSETAWEYVYALSTVTDPTTLSPVAVNNNPEALLTGLASNSIYKVWIRSNCGDGALGNWPQNPYTFKTSCAPVATFSENFDSYTLTGTSNPLPDCWTRFGNTGSSYIATASATPLTAPNRLFLSGSATGSTNGIAVMPPVSNLQTETHRLKFKAYSTTADKSLEIGYFDAEDLTNFIVLEAFEMPSTAIASATEFVYTPEFVGDGVESLAFRVNGGAFTGTTTIYIDDVVWEPIPACPDVSEIEIANVGTTTADITWFPGGSETAWKYVYGPSSVTDPSTLTAIDVSNNPFITITDLTPNTSYKIWIRSNCGPGSLGFYSDPITFTTLCAPVTNFSEDFDSYTATGSANPLPNCWVRAGNGLSYITTGGVAPGTPPNRLYMTANGTALTPTTSIVILPAVSNFDAGTHRLKFRAYASAANRTVEIGYFGDATDLSTYVPLETINITTTTAATAAIYTLIPASIPAGITTFAFKNEGLPLSTTLYIDDVSWEPIPLCPDVNTVVFGSATSTTASISWIPGGSETAWQYVYGLATETNPNTLTPITDVTGAPQATISGLLPATTYKVWVRSVCGTDLGAFSAATTFITNCEAVATFSENFDTSPTGSAAQMPSCWSRAGNGSTYVTTGSATPGSAPNRLYMFASNTTPSQGFAIMPPVSNLEANTHRLKFKAYASSTGKYVEVGYFTNSADLTSFNILETFNLPGTSAAAAQTFTFESSLIPAGITQLVFRNPATPTASTTLYIDDVIWELKPSVVPVCATNVVAVPNATCGNFATVITWNATAETDGYYLNVGTTAGGTDVFNNQDLGLVTSYDFIGGLSTTYFFTVVPYNSAGPATGCVEQSFVTAANGCYCISAPTLIDNSGITNVQVGAINFPNGPVTYFDHTATPVDFSQGLVNNLKVTLATGFTYDTNVWIDLNDNFTFEANELFFTGETPNTNPFVQDASFLLPADAPLGPHRMRIVSTDIVQVPANPCYNGTYGLTLDFTVNVSVVPTCLAPAGVSVDPVSITTSGASLSWSAATTTASEGYDYFYAADGTVPTATTTPTGSVAAGITTLDVTGLSSSTTYKFYVRTRCTTTDFSSWSQPATFTTLCATTTLPYSINFEAVTVPNLPLCTLNENLGAGNNWETATATGNGFTGKVLKYNYSSASPANTWFYTNNVSLTAGTAYSISYKYGNNSTLFVESLKVAYGTSAASAAMTTVLADHPSVAGGVPQTNVVTFTPTVSGNYTFGFQAYSIADQFSLFVDDIIIDSALSNADFENNTFTAYPNPVKNTLTIRYNENISDVTVFNLLGQQLFSRSINATEGKVDMSNLSAGTYLVKVTSGDKVQTMKVIKE